jgi:O-antigen ligase
VALGLVMLYAYVRSKTAFATPVIAAALLAVLWRRAKWVAEHARALYRWGVAFFVLLIAAVVGHGLKHGTLVHVSLTFRWQYWVGAARIFIYHPWLGTGWANFGSWYTAYRLPQAAEEPGDPHNFLVRTFVELGLPGGLLMLAWMLRIGWEWTVPLDRTDSSSNDRQRATDQRAGQTPASSKTGFGFLVFLACTAIVANAVVSIDWSSSSALIIVETFKRALFLIALLAGLCLVSIRSFRQQTLDDRPAPWILTAMRVGLGLFLLHNLIDFSWFENGPMFFFALLAGAVLGMRLPAPESQRARRELVVTSLVGSAVVWMVAGAFIWLPIARAETLAAEADEAIRTSKPVDAPPEVRLDLAKVQQAREALVEAFGLVPYDADYAFRAEQAALLERGQDLAVPGKLLNEAIAADPRKIRYLNARAVLETTAGNTSGAIADYQRILQLDPHNLELRLHYARLLEQLGRAADAARQYRMTLENNDRLAPDEIRRLSPRQVKEIQERITTCSR